MTSDDAARRQDLGLALLPLEPETTRHSCQGGWLPDAGGCAVPCLRCKPHLRRVTQPDGTLAWRAFADADTSGTIQRRGQK